MDRVSLIGQMALDMRVNGLKITCRAQEKKLGLMMEDDIKENGEIVNPMAKELWSG